MKHVKTKCTQVGSIITTKIESIYETEIERITSYSGGMYPKVPTRRVCSELVPYSVNFVSPKSATCTRN